MSRFVFLKKHPVDDIIRRPRKHSECNYLDNQIRLVFRTVPDWVIFRRSVFIAAREFMHKLAGIGLIFGAAAVLWLTATPNQSGAG